MPGPDNQVEDLWVLQEKTQQGRTIGIFLAFGGLLFYSLLTSTMTAQIKVCNV